ncbi:LacI family DNA-binding transcriptional regulator [Cryptosporangium sp. NPDC048952]|uniref:LacI family DNA-binding transcriptional regulator n=1 Tax=Cryptosporangium sp. NPDC048952 TaxID=3363961 RepID=UPI0037204F90
MVTGFDVARLAGVTQPTVSRALRNVPGVSPETRRKVLEAAARLSYVPSDMGRALSTRVNHRVAVVAPELDNPYYPQLVEPLRRELAERGMRTVLVTDGDLDDLADGSYDGVVLTTTRRRSTLPRDLTERGIPHVLANRVLDVPESNGVTIDNVYGAYAVADLLVSLGHETIGMVAGPVDTSTGRERADGVRRRLRSHGVRMRREHVRRCAFDHDAALAAARSLLSRPEGPSAIGGHSEVLAVGGRPELPTAVGGRPTAVVCGNDVIALGVLSAAAELGIEVPAQLTVIGFDDIPMAGWPLVGLTTMRCDLPFLAARAVELLMAAIAAPTTPPEVIRLRPELVLRRTHGPA